MRSVTATVTTLALSGITVSAFVPADRHNGHASISPADAPAQLRLNKLHIKPFSIGHLAVASSFGSAPIDLSPAVSHDRDVHSMAAWAQQYGMQQSEGVEFYSQDGGRDYELVTQACIAAGDSIIWVPSDIVLSSNTRKMTAEFGESLQEAEVALVNADRGAASRLPLFRLMVKILSEYDKGAESSFYPWLNSLPREFYNGVSMTDACFDTLPGYASRLAMDEFDTYSSFANALRQGFIGCISQNTVQNDEVVKWAYNVALTRFHEVWKPTRQKMIAPMADMLNHAAQPNCEISFDNDGNCLVR